MTEVTGNTLVDGRYRILRRIGSGGMADVYCAEDSHLGRQVAIKVLHRRFAQDQEFVERFRREAKSAAGLNHPNVVGVFDRGEHEGTYYIAMEYLTGRTLKDIVTAEAPLPQERVIDLGTQILQAAGFAHRHGVIHRDFKPHNVIVDELGHAKVTDFGIARAGASEMTETGSIMGTAQYLSPEQAQGHAVTATSDIYSIGVMLYEMLAGRLPFEGDSAVAVALKHLSEQPPPISQWRPDVHPALEAVVMAALAKDPAQRWQSAEDLAAALEAARAQIEAGHNGGQDTAAFAPIAMPAEDATAATQVAGAPEPVLAPVADPRREEERRWPWIAIGLLTLALIGALLYVILSGTLTAEKKDVPRVTGKQLVEARAVLERAGFEVQTERVRSAQPFDQVVDQDPNPGEQADEGSTVTLEVSRGPGDVLVPAVANLRQGVAIQELEDAGLKVTVDQEPSDKVKKDFAIRTLPREATKVTRGTRVRLFVSSGTRAAHGAGCHGPVARLGGVAAARRGLRRVGGRAGVRRAGGRRDLPEPGGRDRVGPRRDGHDHRLDRPAAGGRAGRDRTERARRELQAPSSRPRAGHAGAHRHRPLPGRRGGGAATRLGDGGGQGSRGRDRDRSARGRRAAPDDHAGGPMRVAVLAGGRSSEHDVSLSSAESVREGLVEGGHEPLDIRIDREGRWTHDGEAVALVPSGGLLGAEVAFPVLHGPFGEDGTVQGLLELLDIPYVGAGVMASAVAMDKAVFKELMTAHGIPQVDYVAIREGGAVTLPPPVFVKPARLGSSVGIGKAWSEADLDWRARRRVPARPTRAGRALLGRARGGVLRARPPRPDRVAARGDRAHGQRLVRLRGEVPAGRHGPGGAGSRA